MSACNGVLTSDVIPSSANNRKCWISGTYPTSSHVKNHSHNKSSYSYNDSSSYRTRGHYSVHCVWAVTPASGGRADSGRGFQTHFPEHMSHFSWAYVAAAAAVVGLVGGGTYTIWRILLLFSGCLKEREGDCNRMCVSPYQPKFPGH